MERISHESHFPFILWKRDNLSNSHVIRGTLIFQPWIAQLFLQFLLGVCPALAFARAGKVRHVSAMDSADGMCCMPMFLQGINELLQTAGPCA